MTFSNPLSSSRSNKVGEIHAHIRCVSSQSNVSFLQKFYLITRCQWGLGAGREKRSCLGWLHNLFLTQLFSLPSPSFPSQTDWSRLILLSCYSYSFFFFFLQFIYCVSVCVHTHSCYSNPSAAKAHGQRAEDNVQESGLVTSIFTCWAISTDILFVCFLNAI